MFSFEKLLLTCYIHIRRIYSWIFPYRVIEIGEAPVKYLYYSEKKYDDLPANFSDNKLNQEIEYWKERTEVEYVCYLEKPSYKEIYTGWIITKDNELIKASIPQNINPKYGTHPAPNRFDYTFKKHKKIKLGTIISCDSIHNFGPNYFHFFYSFIGQLALLEKFGVDLSLPIIIPKSLSGLKYFEELKLICPKIAKLHFIVQSNEIIEFDKVYFAKTNPYSNITTALVFSYLNVVDSLPKKGDYNIFIGRKNDSNRTIANIDQILSIVKKHKYEIVYPENMTLSEQIQLFSNTKNVIAIHGAGLTNLLFRYPNKYNLFEIFASNWFVAGYYNFTHEIGGNYAAQIGTSENEKGEFSLTISEFNNCLEKWLSKN